ncbi:MAG: YheV family putative metal-binding protein [Pseudomonadales bacterium]|jgi:uncharacterized metal-binding protein (TIGR02443 family)|nr:YheV family putative metal-binding protein [Gammaproteobacteria bacterium]MDA7753659.1 YheV family putative metal-binding protein [Pseudomonadales bacterium]MDC0889419.1 YheV family putative metal-binding protein [bacterium]MDB2449883.1 YheV family putative metal-binding protein [Pseudomonadales bacterium]MDC1083397.1 YheV family putative metal-binding protein [Pseudomonadales bacterium]|tara:strand:- start:994 stop:1248 length:255 start_codon:yes stop_codon:yes gene_type:complete
MSTSASRRRFIAGATCPQCGEVDKVFTQTRSMRTSDSEVASEQRERGCVACDFLETIEEVVTKNAPADVKSGERGDWSPVKLPE